MQPFAIPALVLFIVALPLVLGLIPSNRFYGVRTRATLSDDNVWYPVNRLAGAAIMVASIVYAAVALAWPCDPSASDNTWTWALHLAAFIVPLIVGVSLALWHAKRL